MLGLMRSAYAFLWRDRRFGRFVLVSLVPRAGFFMLPLGLLLYVRGQTGAVSTAGLALGAFGMASATQPLRGRLVDRYGRLVVAACGIACGASVLVVVVAGRSPVALVAACALVGLTVPPTGAFTRAALAAALADEPERVRSAYAADSALTEAALLAGPLLVALVAGFGGSRTALVVAALMIELGAIALSSTSVARLAAIGQRPAGPPAAAPESRDGRAVIRAVLLTTLCVSVALGIVDVAVPIFATRHGSVVDAGLLLGVLAAGTALGALLYGSVHVGIALERQLLLYTAPLLAVVGAMALTAAPLVLGALLILAGLTVGPLYVVLYALIERSARAGDHTRAFSWEVTVTNAGAALGSAAAGLIIANADLPTAFAAAAGAAALGLVVGLALLLAPAGTPVQQPAQG
jgi:MFS family permease